MFSIESVRKGNKIDYHTLRKIDIPNPAYGELREYWIRKQELREATQNLLKELSKNKKLISEMSKKYDTQYQLGKETYQSVTRGTLSYGYELESTKVTDTFSYEKFFKYNETFSKACQNYLKNSEEEQEYTLANWRSINEIRELSPEEE